MNYRLLLDLLFQINWINNKIIILAILNQVNYKLMRLINIVYYFNSLTWFLEKKNFHFTKSLISQLKSHLTDFSIKISCEQVSIPKHNPPNSLHFLEFNYRVGLGLGRQIFKLGWFGMGYSITQIFAIPRREPMD